MNPDAKCRLTGTIKVTLNALRQISAFFHGTFKGTTVLPRDGCGQKVQFHQRRSEKPPPEIPDLMKELGPELRVGPKGNPYGR